MYHKGQIEDYMITDDYGRVLYVDASWGYSDIDTLNGGLALQFELSVNAVWYVVNGIRRNITKLLSNKGIEELKEKVEYNLWKEEII